MGSKLYIKSWICRDKERQKWTKRGRDGQRDGQGREGIGGNRQRRVGRKTGRGGKLLTHGKEVMQRVVLRDIVGRGIVGRARGGQGGLGRKTVGPTHRKEGIIEGIWGQGGHKEGRNEQSGVGQSGCNVRVRG